MPKRRSFAAMAMAACLPDMILSSVSSFSFFCWMCVQFLDGLWQSSSSTVPLFIADLLQTRSAKKERSQKKRGLLFCLLCCVCVCVFFSYFRFITTTLVQNFHQQVMDSKWYAIAFKKKKQQQKHRRFLGCLALNLRARTVLYWSFLTFVLTKAAFLFCGFCFSPLWQEEEGTSVFEFLKKFWFFSQKHFWPRSGDRHLSLILVLSFRFCLLHFCMRKVCIFWCIDLTGRKWLGLFRQVSELDLRSEVWQGGGEEPSLKRTKVFLRLFRIGSTLLQKLRSFAFEIDRSTTRQRWWPGMASTRIL